MKKIINFILNVFVFTSFLIAQLKHTESNYFKKIHSLKIFDIDNKLFADLTPKTNPVLLEKSFEKISQPYNNEEILKWLHINFIYPKTYEEKNFSKNDTNIDLHLKKMWRGVLLKIDNEDSVFNILEKKESYNFNKAKLKIRNDTNSQFSTQIKLPFPYIIPGGRFKEMYYWDSYFTMLGLAINNEMELEYYMLNNFAYLIDSFGFIPNGTRQYYLSRSQPPFFSLMLNLIDEITKKKNIYETYLPQMLKEYNFFMKGSKSLKENEANLHSVKISKDIILNRYFDTKNTPRPESYDRDIEIYNKTPKEKQNLIYANLRAACESGWDFSSRWFENPNDITTIQTLDILPIDLNCLLYILEKNISIGFKNLNSDSSLYYNNLSEKRKQAILKYFWNDKLNAFVDYNWVKKQPQEFTTLACMFPLFAKIATDKQAENTEKLITSKYLQKGGWLTTLLNTKQQWDSPNAWAPLQYITFIGLTNYKYSESAKKGATNFIKIIERVFHENQKIMEKYNVIDDNIKGGGGEYPNQDGFGMTNGTYLMLKNKITPIP